MMSSQNISPGLKTVCQVAMANKIDFTNNFPIFCKACSKSGKIHVFRNCSSPSALKRIYKYADKSCATSEIEIKAHPSLLPRYPALTTKYLDTSVSKENKHFG